MYANLLSSDTTVTTGVGLRWAVTGPYTCNILGGGGGKDGFRNLLEHLGPATRAWTADMSAHAYDWTKENQGKLDKSVQAWLGHTDMQAVKTERYNVLIDLVNLKGNNPALN